jgi:hypothetical protein
MNPACPDCRRFRRGDNTPGREYPASGCSSVKTLPSLLEAARLRVRQPSLNVFARRTGVVASGQQIRVDRPLDALRAYVALLVRQVQRARHVDWLVCHRASLCNRHSECGRGFSKLFTLPERLRKNRASSFRHGLPEWRRWIGCFEKS